MKKRVSPRSRPAFAIRRIVNRNPRRPSIGQRVRRVVKRVTTVSLVLMILVGVLGVLPATQLSADIRATHRLASQIDEATELRDELNKRLAEREGQYVFEHHIDTRISAAYDELTRIEPFVLAQIDAVPDAATYRDGVQQPIGSPEQIMARWQQAQARVTTQLAASCDAPIGDYWSCLLDLYLEDATYVYDLHATHSVYRDRLFAVRDTSLPDQDVTRRVDGYESFATAYAAARAAMDRDGDSALAYNLARAEDMAMRYAAAQRSLATCRTSDAPSCATAERSFTLVRQSFEVALERLMPQLPALESAELSADAALKESLFATAGVSCDAALRAPVSDTCAEAAAWRVVKADIMADQLAIRSVIARYFLIGYVDAFVSAQVVAARELEDSYSIENILGPEWPGVYAAQQAAERDFDRLDAELDRCIERATESTSCNDIALAWNDAYVAFRDATYAAQDMYEDRMQRATESLEGIDATMLSSSLLAAQVVGGAPADESDEEGGFFSSAGDFLERNQTLTKSVMGAGLGAGVAALSGKSPLGGALAGGVSAASGGIAEGLFPDSSLGQAATSTILGAAAGFGAAAIDGSNRGIGAISGALGATASTFIGRAIGGSGDKVSAAGGRHGSLAGCEGFPSIFGISGLNVRFDGGSVSTGCVRRAVLDGPGAQGGLNNFRTFYSGNTYGSAIGMITGWVNFALPFVSVIAIAALVYAGFLYLTAGVNEENVQTAKKIVLYVAIGIILIFAAYAIVNTLISGQAQ